MPTPTPPTRATPTVSASLRPLQIDVVLRGIPGLTWLRLAIGGERIVPGHGWMLHGLVRRDTLTIRGRGLVVAALPARMAPMDVLRDRDRRSTPSGRNNAP